MRVVRHDATDAESMDEILAREPREWFILARRDRESGHITLVDLTNEGPPARIGVDPGFDRSGTP
ncbi:hypothetical protein G6O69_24660 [Pseudenhygromyxa sp. WMMC2535]|uniref:hypothetical protein n=1 Tax=Pseudenhygromyxa sp. WMMC2535 TaxID=2712867 RepID=UPI0015565751|nr:hypothetical protein [Pseudenhygromyxa sp. WMMC2535]NVB41055.1 hypothetical protein [Pseudenhygromyxa sp. WMMC2535]